MNYLKVGGQQIPVDGEGYLRHRGDWNVAVAEALARIEQIELGPEHWEILHLLRDYYDRFEHAPAMRALVRYAGQQLGPEKGRSIHLLRLFPGSPAKIGARIAGLPRPDHCL